MFLIILPNTPLWMDAVAWLLGGLLILFFWYEWKHRDDYD